jgi:hypothetical protein
MAARTLLIFVRGLPGAGKSDLVDLLLKYPPLENGLRLDPDRIDLTDPKFTEFANDLPKEIIPKRQIYRYLLRQAESALRQGQHVIWEQPWRLTWGLYVTIENLTYFLTGETDISKAPFRTVIVEVLIDPAVARGRVAERFAEGRHKLDEKVFEQFVGKLEDCSQLGIPLVQVDGCDVKGSVQPVKILINADLSR